MFCTNCGNRLSEADNFCSSCGKQVTTKAPIQRSEIEKENEIPIDLDLSPPVIIAKPVFVPDSFLASRIPAIIFVTIVLFVLFFSIIPRSGDVGSAIGSTFIFALIAAVGLIYYPSQNAYKKKEFKFYHDGLEYTDGFWNFESKVIKYKNVTNLSFTQGVLQKKHDLGTISIATSSGYTYLPDVKHPDAVYRTVQELIDAQ
ncbi:PH domain-containing protein [Vibrio maritimus]